SRRRSRCCGCAARVARRRPDVRRRGRGDGGDDGRRSPADAKRLSGRDALAYGPRMRRLRAISPALLLGLLLVAGCSDSGGSGTSSALDGATLSSPGPYAVGEAQLTLIDASRPTQAVGSYPGAAERTLPTRIWYPATSAGNGAAPSGDGPF